ncbi:MAG TPA: MerR family transcriptional regulator [Rectinemataceae bacterium]|nr:MerR family transcriptional regulator [Rectinemataceae bacterium]
MASYGMGEAELILGLPASTLRHWEHELSILGPRKDQFGRRRYSTADLRLFLRLKHLALGKGLGLSAAGEALLAELGAPQSEARARIAQLRGELIVLYFAAVEAGRVLDGGPGPRS